MKARLVVRISPADVGARVSIRSSIDAGPGQPTTTDTVGRLLSWTDGVLTVERRDGSVTLLQERDLLAGKLIPEATPRRKDR